MGRGAATPSGTLVNEPSLGNQLTIGRESKTYKHHLASLFHAQTGGTTYFLTFAARPGIEFDRAELAIVMDSVKWGHPKLWHLHGAVVMPEHVHILLTPHP